MFAEPPETLIAAPKASEIELLERVLLKSDNAPLLRMQPPYSMAAFPAKVQLFTIKLLSLTMPPPSFTPMLAEIVQLLSVRAPSFRMPPPLNGAKPLVIVRPEMATLVPLLKVRRR